MRSTTDHDDMADREAEQDSRSMDRHESFVELCSMIKHQTELIIEHKMA